jgi:hypothetical protein
MPGEGADSSPVDLAFVCARIPEIRTALGPAGVPPLQGLTEAVQRGDDLRPALDAVHRALLAAGDALGVYGHGSRGLEPAGVESVEIVYRCPLRKCAGRDRAEFLRSSQLCEIGGERLLRERL